MTCEKINRFIVIILFFSTLFFLSAQTHLTYGKTWSVFFDSKYRKSIDLNLDAYYSSLGLNLPLSSGEKQVLDASAEQNLYFYLIKNFLKPQSIRFEASINPMPIGGVYLKSNYNSIYNRAEVMPSLNLIRSISEGFPDPGALSLFLGNQVYFGDYETKKIKGIGYGGFLLSYGNYHIVSNNLIPDNWIEAEFKLKGGMIDDLREIFFSFRFGSRVNFEPNIHDSVYFSIKRDRVDRSYFGLSPIKNSSLELRLDVNLASLNPSRFLLLFGKKISTPGGKYVFSLSMGVLGIFKDGYSGKLADDKVVEGWTFLFRPNVKF